MEFLRLNNIPIPILDGSAEYSFEELGNRQRTMDGQLRSTRTALKRVWRFKTPVLDPETALMIDGLLAGNGHHWSYDIDAFDLKGFGPLDPAASNVYSLRRGPNLPNTQAVETGMKYGGAVSVERATTNLFPTNVRTGTDASANTTGFAAVDALGVFQSTDVPGLAVGWVAFQGTRVLEFLTSAVVNGIRAGIKTSGVVGVALTTYTASVYVQATGAVRCRLRDVTNGIDGTIQTVNPSTLSANIGQNVWLRISSTVTTGGLVPTLEFELLEDVADSAVNCYSDQFQLEALLGPTSWVDGARGAGLLKCDVQSFLGSGRTISEDIRTAVDLTVMLWLNRRDDRFSFSGRGFANIFENAANVTAGGHYFFVSMSAGFEFGNTVTFGVTAGANELGGTVSTTSLSAFSTVPLNTWVHVAAVMRRNVIFGSDLNKLKLYVGGVLVAQSLVTGVDDTLPDLSRTRMLTVGGTQNSAGTPSLQFDGGMIDDLVVVPYAMTAAAISSVFSAGRAFSDLPRLDAEGAGIVTPPPRAIVLGELPSGEFVQAVMSATFVQNNRTVEITLVEV